MENSDKLFRKVPLKAPKPNIDTFCKVIKREMIPYQPPLVELFVDGALMKYFMEQKAGVQWVDVVPGDRDSRKGNVRSQINFWYR